MRAHYARRADAYTSSSSAAEKEREEAPSRRERERERSSDREHRGRNTNLLLSHVGSEDPGLKLLPLPAPLSQVLVASSFDYYYYYFFKCPSRCFCPHKLRAYESVARRAEKFGCLPVG